MDGRPASCLPPPGGHPLPTSLEAETADFRQGFCSSHAQGRVAPPLPLLSRLHAWQLPLGCQRALACGSAQGVSHFFTSFTCIFFVSSTPPSASCFLAIPLQTQNLIPPTQASRSEGMLQVSRAVCSPSCLERCPTIPAPRPPQMPISAASTGSPAGLCALPLSVLGLQRPHMDPQKTPNSQRTLEKQPIGRCHAL